MYLHTKFGFVEIDRWDGTKTGLLKHDQLLTMLAVTSKGNVFVVRARAAEVVRDLLEATLSGVRRQIFESPQSWDYQFRVYLTEKELAALMAGVVKHLDYRNFKSWAVSHAPKTEAALAKEIWHAAHEHGKRRGGS